MNRPQNSRVAIAWYRRDQWELLRAVSTDGQSLEQTYDEWAAFASKQVRDLESKGFEVHKIEVELNALRRWCEGEGRAVDGRPSRVCSTRFRMRVVA
jgi:YD repeat-containing protein